MTLSQAQYDLAGRVTRQTNALLGVTSYTNVLDGSGQTIKTNTYPDGGTRIEIYYQDGSLQKILGTAAYPVRYVYGVTNDGAGRTNFYTAEIKLNSSGADTSEIVTNFTDMLGRPYKTVYAAPSAPYPTALSYYNLKGQCTNQVDPDGFMTLFKFNGRGEQEYQAADMNTDGNLDFAGTDRITRTVTDVGISRALPLALAFSVIPILCLLTRLTVKSVQTGWTRSTAFPCSTTITG